MKISLNEIRYYRGLYSWSGDPAPQGVDALVEKLGAQLGAVEEVENLGETYKGIVIAKVVSCTNHPDSDHMHVCLLDDGGVVQNVDRNEQGYVQVVCGAPNVREGLLVAWLPPGSTVPESVGKDPFVLGARELRGVTSNGMIASMRELALGDDHEGILEVDEDAKPGDDFAKTYGLDDYIIDIENKMFTHRPDCFGMIGVAREIAGIQHQAFKSPDWYRPDAQVDAPEGPGLKLQVTNELPEEVPRFVAVAMDNITVGPSPLWLQISLIRLGLRPINNIVDLTNYYMLLTGQPIHAYDYDKVAERSNGDGAAMVIRRPHPGENITLLNGKTIEPRSEAMMVATDKELICVGGAMGGADTEVSGETKNIIIEAANWDMYSIRRTAMAHGIFTDAVTRFNKGQSPLQNRAVVAKIVGDIRQIAGGNVASEMVDLNQVQGREWVHPPVPVTAEFINVRLGTSLAADEMKTLLENVECQVAVDGDTLTVTAPFWRTDIETREDAVEEVGRLYGYDRLPLELPKRSIKPVAKNTTLELKGQLRTTLAKAGANEVLTYSFVHGDLLQKAGQDPADAFQVGNALSPDLQYYRLSLTPSLLDKVHSNIKAGYDEFALFEIGKSHFVGEMAADDPDVPNEDTHLALVVAYGDKKSPAGAPYYHARKYLGQVMPVEGALVPLTSFDLESDKWGKQLAAPYEPGRSAVIVRDGQIWGVVGEFKASVRRALKLPPFAAGFEVHLDVLSGRTTDYQPLPRFPKVTQDITLKVAADLPLGELAAFVEAQLAGSQLGQVLARVEPLDLYQRTEDTAHKQATFRLSVASYERTLTDTEVNKLLDDVAAAAGTKFGAERM
ncbi:MAG TPA: phenylalanine--tRNA ligase subunit beta [Candidatus Saccharimonadales bacterium]|nr:phenylalanine--tRNA ligase subunit beta [Candidatus Saccharimonadales bacterium]